MNIHARNLMIKDKILRSYPQTLGYACDIESEQKKRDEKK